MHLLGEGQLCAAVTAHLGRPCIADAGCLLRDLASAAALDMAALRQSSPDLARMLECRAAEIQAAVAASRAYWLELEGLLTAQHQARPARLRVVRRSQCLHHRRRRLVTKGWQPRAYNPDTKPACAGLMRGVVSRNRRALFSDITVGPTNVGTTTLSARCPSSPSSRKRASREAARQGAQAPHARARCQPSREDFDNHAG